MILQTWKNDALQNVIFVVCNQWSIVDVLFLLSIFYKRQRKTPSWPPNFYMCRTLLEVSLFIFRYGSSGDWAISQRIHTWKTRVERCKA